MTILKRKALINDIISYDSRDTVKLLTGVRRSGKTTLIKSIIEELKGRGVDEENILYYSFASCKYDFGTVHDIYKAIDDKISDIAGKVYLFFDDVEEFEDWQGVVNYFRRYSDCDVCAAVNYSKFYTIGDNRLGGRSLRFEVYPFSFREFLEYKREFTDEEKSVSDFFAEYLRYGGMPEIVKLDAEDRFWMLEAIFDEIRFCDFIKDSDVDSFRVRDFLRYMIETFTEKFSRKEINKYNYDMFDGETLSVCLNNLTSSSFMPSSNIIYDGHRFKWEEKYYLIDHGFYTQLNRFYNISPENLIRNIVFIELLRRKYRVFFTESHEKYVDFICQGHKRRIFIQFDYMFASPTVIEKEIGFLNSAAGDNEKYIITVGDYDFSDYGVKHLNVIDFLLGDEI